MKITFTLQEAKLMRRFSPPCSRRERLNLLWAYASPLILIVSMYFGQSRQDIRLILLVGTALLYGIVTLLLVTAWGLKVYAARSNHSSTQIIKISEAELLCQAVDGPVLRYPWTHLQEVADWEDYFAFTSSKGQHLAVIPKSAFKNADQAHLFFMQSRHYWEAAKNETIWPPAPLPQNSAELDGSRNG